MTINKGLVKTNHFKIEKLIYYEDICLILNNFWTLMLYATENLFFPFKLIDSMDSGRLKTI